MYDAHGRVWRIERDGVANIEYAFDAVTGLPTTKKYFTHAQYQPANALVRTTSFAYDAIGRVQTETHTLADDSSSKVFTFYYDGATPSDLTARTTVGLLTAVAGDRFTRILEYRPDAKVKRKVLSLGDWREVETTYSYLESGILGSRTIQLYDGTGRPPSTSTQSYFHDGHGRLGTVKLNGALLATFDYDPNGQISGASFANGNRLELTYDPLTRRHTGASLATSDYSSSTSLRLNARGLVDNEMLTVGAVNLSRAYGYSAQRFLTSAADPQNNYAYDFDGFGLPKLVTTNGTTRRIVESPNSLVAGTVTYEFDGLHRTVSRTDSAAPAQNLTLTYGPDGHLASAVRDGVTYTFLYDEAGQRLVKFSGAIPVAAFLEEGYLDGTGLTERFAVAGRTVGTIKNGLFTALATDLRGSVMAETTGTPRIGSPFGQRDIHPAQAAAIDYVEKGYDADLGWVRMGVRDYDPEINRFTTPDPLFLEHAEKCIESPIECNLFGYARQDPLRYVDPSGEAGIDTLIKEVAGRALSWLEKRGATVAAHTAKRHVARLAYPSKSKFATPNEVNKLARRTIEGAEKVTNQGRRLVFEKQFGREIGTNGERVVRVVVEKTTGKIVTAFPSKQFLSAAAIGAALSESQEAHAAIESHEKSASNHSRDWLEKAVTFIAGGSDLGDESVALAPYQAQIRAIAKTEQQMGRGTSPEERDAIHQLLTISYDK